MKIFLDLAKCAYMQPTTELSASFVVPSTCLIYWSHSGKKTEKKMRRLRGQNGHLAGMLLPPWGGISLLGDVTKGQFVCECFATHFPKNVASKSKEWTCFIPGG